MDRSRRPIECINITAHEIGISPSFFVKCLDFMPVVNIKAIKDKINVSCNVVCTINGAPFITVTPNTLWLTPDMLASGEFEITSNTSWFIN